VRRARAVVVTAAPGAGKTTRVPPALVADGRVILLQPRRVAARAIAARIAEERGWTLGREVGWQIRFERRFTSDTQLLVVTEGILTARLQSDPLLSEFRTVIVDEFHERSIHADVALALARQAWRARSDLRVVVMSATLDSAPVSAFFDNCPIVDVPGRVHPVDVAYAPGRSVAAAARDVLAATDGQVLCFLPGAFEIRKVIGELATLGSQIDVVPLHGSLDAAEQDLALRPSSRRRVIVATNIAETSLTVPGVTAVVDTGLHKVARYDAERGIDSLETERVTADAADQRAGRAGRMAPGVVRRLWDARDRLRPHREPEIHRVDLASAALDVIAWGGDPRTLEWFERPRADAIDAAFELLTRLGVIERGRADGAGKEGGAIRLTPVGARVHKLPLHPRLARMLVAANGARDMARACALLSERHALPPRAATTTSDLLSAIDRWDDVPAHVRHVASNVASAFGRANEGSAPRSSQTLDEREFRRALLTGYPDRVAQRRDAGSANVLLASGTGAAIAAESGVRGGDFLIAHDIGRHTAPGGHGLPPGPSVPRIRMATIVERDWLGPTSSEPVHRFDPDSGTVKARRVDRYDALVLAEHPVRPDAEIAARLLAEAWLERGPRSDDEQMLRRLRFAGRDADLAAIVHAAAYGARQLDDISLAHALPAATLRDLDRDAPESIAVPSGRRARLEYAGDGSVSASVKLQELFGLADTPTVGPRRVPVALALLAPNGRPVQVTRDLRSFWNRTYPEVRKELRGRYPKHPWPEDPWSAVPTARTTRK
jgi:ATP-dependent helicase HrpB